MKTKTMSLLLALTLLSFGFGFFAPAGAFAMSRSSGDVREFRVFPSFEEQRSINSLISEARVFSDQINFSVRLEDNGIVVTLTGEDADTIAWLQEHFGSGRDSFSGQMPDGKILGRVEYAVTAIGGGVEIAISSHDQDFIVSLHDKLKKTVY